MTTTRTPSATAPVPFQMQPAQPPIAALRAECAASVGYTPFRSVTIPACAEHEGIYQRTVTLVWRCPVCGAPRGNVEAVASYDGSRRMIVDGWTNACSHIDTYVAVRNEAASNGLNGAQS